MHTMQAQHHSVYELTDKSFAVFGPVKASNTLGFCHVRNEKSTNPGSQFYFKYKGKDCNNCVSKGKQEKMRSIYIHLHTLFCSLQLANGMPAVANPPSTSALATHSSCPPSEDFQSHRIFVLRAATMRLYTNKTLPYHFGTDLMSRIKMKDALTFQGSSDGWPLLFAVESKVCKVCGNPLGPARVHPGSRGSIILYTNLNTFKEVVIHVSECTETSCKAMHRVFPTDPGKTVKLCNENCKRCERFWD